MDRPLVYQLFCHRCGNHQRLAVSAHIIHKAVCRLCPFEDDIWPMLLVQTKEAFVQFAACSLFHANSHLYACIAELLHTSACHLRIRVKTSYHHTPNAFADNQVSAWRSLAIVRTGLERHIECHAAIQGCFLCFRQSFHPLLRGTKALDLCMSFAKLPMPPFRKDTVTLHQHRPHHRVRSHVVHPVLGELYAAMYIIVIRHEMALIIGLIVLSRHSCLQRYENFLNYANNSRK